MAQKRSQTLKPIGLSLDLTGSEINDSLYTMAVNMVPRENRMQRIGGFDNVYGTPLTAPRHLQAAKLDGIDYWVYVGGTTAGVTDQGGTHTDITHASGITSSKEWSSDIIHNLPVLNNPDDDPMYWDGNTANNLVTLPGWLTDKCAAIRTYGTYLLALGLTSQPNKIAWSDEAVSGTVPTTWTPSSTNDAGSRELGETPGNIIDGQRLRNSFIVYKEFSAYLMNFTGDNNVFSFQLLYEDIGCVSLNAVTEARNRHYVMTRDDIIVHDGVSRPVSLAEGRFRNFYADNLNLDNTGQCYVVNNVADAEIWFCFPDTSADIANRAIIYNIETNEIGARLISFPYIAPGIVSPNTLPEAWSAQTANWDTITTTWNQNLTGAGELSLLAADETNTQLVSIDQTTDDRGVDITSSVSRSGLTFGDPTREKLITGIYPRIIGEAGQTYSIRIGGQKTIDGPITWGSSRTFTLGTDERVDADTLARYIAIEISNTSQSIYKVESMDIEFQLRGRHGV